MTLSTRILDKIFPLRVAYRETLDSLDRAERDKSQLQREVRYLAEEIYERLRLTSVRWTDIYSATRSPLPEKCVAMSRIDVEPKRRMALQVECAHYLDPGPDREAYAAYLAADIMRGFHEEIHTIILDGVNGLPARS